MSGYQLSAGQLQALAAPVRHDILDRLIALGPLSATEIAGALGRAPTALYHHLRQLEAVGLITARKADGAPAEPGRPGLRYAAVGPLLFATEAGRDPANRQLIARLVRAASVQAARDFEGALAAEARVDTGSGRNQRFFRAVARPSPERLARINALLDELTELVSEPDPQPGPLVSFAWISAPLERPRQRRRASPSAAGSGR